MYKPCILIFLVTVATAQHHQPPQQPHQPPQPLSPTSSGNSLGLLQPFEDQEETEIDEEYWRKYPDLRPGSMSRELTEVEADSLHTELKEAVATFFGGSCSHSSSFDVRILSNLRLNLYYGNTGCGVF